MPCRGGVCSRKPSPRIPNPRQGTVLPAAAPSAQPGGPLPTLYNVKPQKENKSTWQSFKEWLTGTPEGLKLFERFTPDQQQALSQVLQMGLGGLQNTPFSFEPIAQREVSRFYKETVPTIAERFTALGTGGSQRSSAFPAALAAGGADLGERLASQASRYNLLQQGNLQNLLQLGLTPRFESLYTPSRQGFAQSTLGALGQGLGAYAPLMLGSKLFGL